MNTLNEEVIHTVNCAEIYVDDSFNCRGTIAPIDVLELAKSIQDNGQLVEIWVRPIIRGDYKYSLIAGYRRYTAIYKINKTPTIRAKIFHVDEGYARILNLVENLERKDLNILQEAHAIQALIDQNYSAKRIAEELKKSYVWVDMRMRLLQLPVEIQQDAAAGWITQDQIKKIHKLKTPEEQFAALRRIKDRKLAGDRSVPMIDHKSVFSKRGRNRAEMGHMRDHVYDVLGPGIAARTLAWATGEISDMDLFDDLRAECERNGKKYYPPAAVVEALS